MKPFSWRITEGATDLMQIWTYSDFIDMILIFFKKNMEKVSKLMNRFYCFTKCCIGSTVEQVVLLCFMLTFSPLPSYSFRTLASVLFTAVKATVLPVSAPVP